MDLLAPDAALQPVPECKLSRSTLTRLPKYVSVCTANPQASPGPKFSERVNPVAPGVDTLAPDAALPAVPEYRPFRSTIAESPAFAQLDALFRQRIAFIDGAMGTMIQVRGGT